jgi:hypothetical protein
MMTSINQELYEALSAAGAPDDAAKRAAANVVSEARLSDLATKADLRAELAELKTELKVDIAGVRTEIERMGRVIIMWGVGIAIGALATMTGILIALLKAMVPGA